jgi:hypothetical protein
MLVLYRLGLAKPGRSPPTNGPGRCWPTSSARSPHGELQRLNEQILRRDPSLGLSEPARQAVRPSRLDRQPGSLEVGQHQDVEQLGAGSGTERV